MKRWYLVHTKPRKEMLAETNLNRQGYEVYLPLIKQPRHLRGRWTDVVEPLFTRYLFVSLEFGHDDIGPIRSTIGVHNLVRFAEEPAVVSDQIIESLKLTADQRSGLHHPKRALFESGDVVVVDRGSFAGLKAIFLAETGQERAAVLLTILGRENRVTVDRNLLRSA